MSDHVMTANGGCRFMDRCLACVKAGCIWLQQTLVPCRSSLDDVEIRPRTIAKSEEDCFDLLRNEDRRSHSLEYGRIRGNVEGINWIWAMILCVTAALALGIGIKYRPLKAKCVSFFRRH